MCGQDMGYAWLTYQKANWRLLILATERQNKNYPIFFLFIEQKAELETTGKAPKLDSRDLIAQDLQRLIKKGDEETKSEEDMPPLLQVDHHFKC